MTEATEIADAGNEPVQATELTEIEGFYEESETFDPAKSNLVQHEDIEDQAEEE